MAKITFTNMIPVDGAYYPTQKLTESERETAQGFTNKPVMADIIASDELTAWSQKAAERVSDALSRYYSSHVDEYKGV